MLESQSNFWGFLQLSDEIGAKVGRKLALATV